MNVNQINMTQGIDISNLDIESAMLMVQSQRANLLEAQLKEQISTVQAKNEQISKLNLLIGEMNKATAKFNSDAKADATTAVTQELKDAAKNAGITLPSGFGSSVSKGTLDGSIQQIKSQIDSMTNNQQMDMLRLQSLNNKRNEAFDLMTNFIKKMQESRSSIIGNMR